MIAIPLGLFLMPKVSGGTFLCCRTFLQHRVLARADEEDCNAHENMGIASLLPPHSGLALALVLFPGARALPRQGSSSVVDAGAHTVRRWTPPNPTQGCSQWLWFAGLHEGRNAGGCTTHGTGSGYYAQYSAALASAQHYAGTVLVPVLLLGRFGLANSSQLSPFGRWATSKGVVVFPVARLDLFRRTLCALYLIRETITLWGRFYAFTS